MAQNEMDAGQGLNQVLSNAFGVQGPPAPFMASEIFPTLVLGNERPEWAYLENHRLVQGARADAAVAGQYSSVGLHNPASSGVIAVVEKIFIVGAVGGDGMQIRIDTTPTADATGSGGWWRDTRLSGIGAPVCNLFDRTNASQAGYGNLIGAIEFPVAASMMIEGPWVLGPDGYIRIGPDLVNRSVYPTFFYREYPATDGELRGI